MKKLLKNLTVLASLIWIVITLSPITAHAEAAESKVGLNKSEVYLIDDETATLKVDGVKEKVKWSSSNDYYVTVSDSGEIETSNLFGTAFIKAEVNNQTYKCKVIGIDSETIHLLPNSFKVVVNGDPVNLFVMTNENFTRDIKNLGVTYKITGNDGVTIDTSEDFTAPSGSFSNARIKAVKSGKFKVSVYAHGIKLNTVTMEAVEVGSTKLDPVDAVKYNDFTGYEGNSLTTLTSIRKYLESKNLYSGTASDRDKIMALQQYLIDTQKWHTDDEQYDGFISRVWFDGCFLGDKSDGDCSAYATIFCFLCECVNIPCYQVGGCVGDAGHAWNKVKVDGTWYYIDAYWCACLHSIDTYYLTETLWADRKIERRDGEGYYADVNWCSKDQIPYAIDIQ